MKRKRRELKATSALWKGQRRPDKERAKKVGDTDDIEEGSRRKIHSHKPNRNDTGAYR